MRVLQHTRVGKLGGALQYRRLEIALVKNRNVIVMAGISLDIGLLDVCHMAIRLQCRDKIRDVIATQG